MYLQAKMVPMEVLWLLSIQHMGIWGFRAWIESQCKVLRGSGVGGIELLRVLRYTSGLVPYQSPTVCSRFRYDESMDTCASNCHLLENSA